MTDRTATLPDTPVAARTLVDVIGILSDVIDSTATPAGQPDSFLYVNACETLNSLADDIGREAFDSFRTLADQGA